MIEYKAQNLIKIDKKVNHTFYSISHHIFLTPLNIDFF